MRLRCKERLKESRLNLRGNPAAGILYANNKEPVDDIGLDLHDAGALYRIDTVSNEVLQHLPQQTIIEPDLRARCHQLCFDTDIGRCLEIGNQLLDGSVRTSPLQVRLREPRELQVFADDVVQAIEFFEHRTDQALRL